MSLLELKEYLQKRDIVTMSDLSIHFRASPETLEPMLKHWIRKGKLSKEGAGDPCGKKHGTCSCHYNQQIYYKWLG